MQNSIEKLVKLFTHFPGIGPRQARRFVYFLLAADKNSIKELTKAIEEVRAETSHCRECFRYFSALDTSHLDDKNLCLICRDPGIPEEKLLIVEKDIDLENIKKSGGYTGRYFVLGGLVPILDKAPEESVRIRELTSRVEKDGKENKLKEIIFALSANPLGDHTIDYLREILDPIAAKYNIKISVIGRGLSTGTELEYSDADTIKSALQNRR